MVALPFPRLPEGPTVRWRSIVTILLAKAAWDTVGLLAGDVAYQAPSYDVLRSLPPVGGMRLRGLMLAALTAYAFYAAHRCGSGGRARPLRVCLWLYAIWYMTWAAGLVGSWIYHSQILSWTAPASVLVVAVLFILAARAAPPRAGGG